MLQLIENNIFENLKVMVSGILTYLSLNSKNESKQSSIYLFVIKFENFSGKNLIIDNFSGNYRKLM